MPALWGWATWSNTAQAFSQTRHILLLSLVFLIFIFLFFGDISGLYDLVNKSCSKQRKKNPGNETHIAFFLMAVTGEWLSACVRRRRNGLKPTSQLVQGKTKQNYKPSSANCFSVWERTYNWFLITKLWVYDNDIRETFAVSVGDHSTSAAVIMRAFPLLDI